MLNQYFIKMRKINVPVIGAGFVFGLVLQFNWAQEFLVNQGLFFCIGKYWSRMLISALAFAFVFMLIGLLSGQKYRKEISRTLTSFYLCGAYLLFYPTNMLLELLIISSLVLSLIYEKNVLPIFGKQNNQLWKNIGYVYGSIFLFLLVKELLIIINHQHLSFTYQHYIRIFLAPVILLIIPVLWPKVTKIYALVVFIAYFVFSAITNVHLITYGADMPHSAYYAIWETNQSEATDYVNQYLNFPIISIHLAILIIGIFLITRIKRINPDHSLLFNEKIICLVLFFVVGFYSNSYSENLPYKFVTNLFQYKKELNKFQSEIEFRKNNPIQNKPAIVCDKNIEEQTIVLVIGESASKYHQGLYGYCRNTNPLLSTIKDELYIYDSVVAPHAHTNPVLSKLLTFANYDNMDPLYNQRTIIEYFHDAGYKTFWLSNQQFANQYSTMSSSVGIQADWYIFTQQDGDDSDSCQSVYDGALIKPFELSINDKAPKKFIIVHLMGSHSDKTKRYPPEFAQFKTDECLPKQPYISNWVVDLVNAHDNSVLYTDYVLYQLISKLKEKNNMAAFLYLSDHGEEMYDYRDFWGHSEANASVYTLDIPFVLWLSEKSKEYYPEKVEKLSHYLSRKYQSDDVIHSVIDLSNCRSEEYDSTRSIFSPYFEFRKRRIDDVDYDEMIGAGKKSVTD